MGSNEETILKVLGVMEENVGSLLEEIDWLKHCVKGKEVLKINRCSDPGFGDGRSEGRDLGRELGQREMGTGRKPCGSASLVGLWIGPGRRPKEGLEGKAEELVEDLWVDSPSSLGWLLLENAQTQSCLVVKGPNAPVHLVSPAKDGFLVDFLSSAHGLSMENAQTKPCVVDGGPMVIPVQSDVSEHDLSLLGSPTDSFSLEMVSFEENKCGNGAEKSKFLAPVNGEPDSVCGSKLIFFYSYQYW